MKLNGTMKMYLLVAASVVLLVFAFWRYGTNQSTARIEKIIVPTLTAEARAGEATFNENCAKCHGKNAAGTDRGPPLVHDIYNPGHHADAAFYLAVQRGVPRHHWRFGNMPPLPDVTRADVASIVIFIRELQVANGIKYRRHQM